MDFLSKIITLNKNNQIYAPVSGKIISLHDVPDKAFSNKLIGDGLAIEVSSNCIYAPCQGKINIIAPTRHAFGIITPDGVEILVHIGIQLLKPSATNYNYQIKVGDSVDVGTPIVTLSDELLKKYNYKIITPIVICNHHNHPIKTMTTSSTIKAGKTIYTYK
ncbi:PTS sugar transporter subunit IIA [Thomasclavelia sp.]